MSLNWHWLRAFAHLEFRGGSSNSCLTKFVVAWWTFNRCSQRAFSSGFDPAAPLLRDERSVVFPDLEQAVAEAFSADTEPVPSTRPVSSTEAPGDAAIGPATWPQDQARSSVALALGLANPLGLPRVSREGIFAARAAG